MGRELHDDLAQKVALLEFQIEGLKRRLSSQPQVIPELESLHGSVAMLAEDVHRICFRLHPVILDTLGLVRGIEFLCEEQARTTGVEVAFDHGPIPHQLSPGISLCLYRVVQEALQNLAKHAETKEAHIELYKVRSGLRMVIQDAGRGFEMNAASAKSGLGLVFMSERVRLLGGRCTIHSAPGKGTRITAHVPVPASDVSSNVGPMSTVAATDRRNTTLS